MSALASFRSWIVVLAMTCLLLGFVLASVALPLGEPAKGTVGDPLPPQTCSRPSTCETDAAERARAVGPLRARGKERNRRRTPVAVSNRAGGGFDWGDAGVGAGAGLGLALVGGACVLVIRRRGRAGLADR
jgi:hypothetical protein